MGEPTKCVIYRRYSSDEQGKGEGETLATQLEACRAYAARKGWEVTEVLTDEGFSAFKGEHLKPGAALYAFVQRVMAGEVDRGTVLLAFKQNRLSRLELDETMVWIYSLTSRGIGIAIVDSDDVFEANPSIEKYLGMSLRAALANKESKDKSDLVTKAKHVLWAKAETRTGKWVNLANRPPLWLKRNEERNGWIIDQHRAALIRQIYEWSADGAGAVRITNRLNTMGEKPWGKFRKNQNKWVRSSVRQLLANPAVEGDLVPVAGMFEGRVIHDFFPRIVDADVVKAARANKTERQKKVGKRVTVGVSNLFAGFTRCGVCGRNAFLSSSITKGKKYAYIRCEASSEGACKNGDYFAYPAFEATALDMCVDLALDDRFFEATGELREARIKLAEIEKAIGDKRVRRKKIMAAFDEDDQDAIDLARVLKTEIEGLEAQLIAVRKKVEEASGKVDGVEHLRRVNDIREAASDENPMVREQARAKLRLALSAIVSTVEIDIGEDGKFFTLILSGGIMAVRIDTKGKVIKAVSDAMGRPLHAYLDDDRRAVLAPLIKRIEDRMAA